MKHKVFIKALCLICALGLLLIPIPRVQAQETEEAPSREIHIRTVQQFLDLTERCRMDTYSQGLTVYLDRDLDLTGIDFPGIPIFEGTLEGRHHKITGLSITAGGSELGLVRYLTEDGLIRDLHVQGSLAPEGSCTNIGGIVGINGGRLENCSFDGTIRGKDSIGGIAGTNGLTGIIERCTVHGSIAAEHRIGGIAGENLGVIRDCGNLAQLNVTPQDNTVKVTAITMDTLTGTEDPHTVTDVGGIAGCSTGVIRGCTNRGSVGYVHMGYNLGGIAGSHSGLIADCQNYGRIQARKEAGGIVGQFIPAAKIEYEKDTLQILEEQLNGTTAALNQAAYNTQHNMGVIGEGIGMLRDDAGTALEAIEQLKPGADSAPDPDQILAAKNALEQSVSSLESTMSYLQEATAGTAGQISKDLQRVSGKVSAMSQTIRNADKTTGASLQDVSDQDTPEDLTGKVVSCTNYGPVAADINAGGIAGAISFEAEEDPEEELIVEGKQSLNAKGQLRAVILDCENKATVSGKKIYAGGIAGKVTLGLIRSCSNTGMVSGEKSQYIGGIAGYSKGYLRSCHVKCILSGSGYVGGIAGSASMASDCQSMVLIQDAVERRGAILGYREPWEDPKLSRPLSDNFYMNLEEDPGGIDGVSYDTLAQPMAPSLFLNQEDLPQAFRSATLTFRYEDGTQKEITIPVGTELRQGQIPALPAKEGFTAAWKGLEEIRKSPVYFDASFTPDYVPNRITVASLQTRKNGRPVLLAEGGFPQLEHMDLGKLPLPELERGEPMEAWSLPRLTEAGETVLHYHLPEDADPQHLLILLRDGEGSWREAPFTVNASSAILSCTPEDQAICAAALPDYGAYAYLAWLFGGLLALGSLICLKHVLRRRKSSGE